MRPDSHRRKWDRDEYEKLAQERVREEEEEEEAKAGPSKAGAKRKSSDDAFDNLVRKKRLLQSITMKTGATSLFCLINCNYCFQGITMISANLGSHRLASFCASWCWKAGLYLWTPLLWCRCHQRYFFAIIFLGNFFCDTRPTIFQFHEIVVPFSAWLFWLPWVILTKSEELIVDFRMRIGPKCFVRAGVSRKSRRWSERFSNAETTKLTSTRSWARASSSRRTRRRLKPEGDWPSLVPLSWILSWKEVVPRKTLVCF